ncbi:MAG: DUF2207 domain-containing protein [Propionibacteriaceae bacterium]
MKALVTKISLVAAILFAALTMGLALPAQAVTEDTVTLWDATYTVDKSGELTVVEKLTYVFPRDNAQGIIREYTVRESWTQDSSKDRLYEITVDSVSATSNVSAAYATTEIHPSNATSERARALQVKVGTKGSYLPANTPITYTITYRVKGALINKDNHGDELYWDVLPVGFRNPVKATKITVNTPAAKLKEISCYAGQVKTNGKCANSDSSNGVATFSQGQRSVGEGITIGVIMPTGTVTDTQPILTDSESVNLAKRFGLAGLCAAVSSVISTIAAKKWWRRNAVDERFLELPPGVMPAHGQETSIGADNKPNIPVSFIPPRVTPGEAGLIADGIVDVRDTTATLIDLAVRGVVVIHSNADGGVDSVQLRSLPQQLAPHEFVLLQKLFPTTQVGELVDISEPGTMSDAHDDVSVTLIKTMKNYYRHHPSALKLGKMASVGAFGWIFIFSSMSGGGLAYALTTGMIFIFALILPVAIALTTIAKRRLKGQRNAYGRALADQTEGFRTYLATAEAEQLKFEEGEDIFSKYLPWAIMFGLTERWTKVCSQLVAMGRIPDAQPNWYYGHWYGYSNFDAGIFNQSMSSAASSHTSSDSGGFGSGGSSSGGGGSVGGGGGGGGGGSW